MTLRLHAASNKRLSLMERFKLQPKRIDSSEGVAAPQRRQSSSPDPRPERKQPAWRVSANRISAAAGRLSQKLIGSTAEPPPEAHPTRTAPARTSQEELLPAEVTRGLSGGKKAADATPALSDQAQDISTAHATPLHAIGQTAGVVLVNMGKSTGDMMRALVTAVNKDAKSGDSITPTLQCFGSCKSPR